MHMWGGMGKGTYRVTQSNLRFFIFLVLWGMISALEGGLFIGHKNSINNCEFFKRMFLKTILGYYRSLFPCLLTYYHTTIQCMARQVKCQQCAFFFQLEEGTLTLDAFDVCICTTGIYNKVKPLHRTLRAKMPTPRRGMCPMLHVVLFAMIFWSCLYVKWLLYLFK